MPKRRQQQATARRRAQADSNTYRFFVDPTAIAGGRVQIDDPHLAHQISNVLRLSAGDQITLLDDSGWEYAVTIETISRDLIDGAITSKQLAQTEPHVELTLYVALLRGEKFEWVLQKGTEIGASMFVPVVCQRSVIDDVQEIGAGKTERWERIVREAAEQSRRARLPKLCPAMLFDTACDHASRRSRAYLLWEASGAASLRALLREPQSDPAASTPFSMALLSGPEGGFSDDELATARRYGLKLASLGPRTLRAETAPIAAAAAVLWECGDLG